VSAAPEPLDPAQRRLTLVAVCIGQGMILLDNTIVNVALPAIQRGLRVTPGALEWTINAYVLALASLIILGGTLGDRYGRKRLYLFGLGIFTVFSAACGFARTDAELIVSRALQGAGAAIMAPLSLSILVDAYPPERRTTAIGIWASVAGLGFAAGPIVGGLLIALFGWSAVFFVNVPIAVVGFAVALASVRESRDQGARSLDPVGTVLVTVGLFLLTFAVIETNVHHWLSTYTLSLGAVAVLCLAAFVAHEARTTYPMVPLALFRDPVFSAANALYALAYAALAGMFFFVTLYYQNVKGWSAVRAGMSWIPLNLFFLVVSPLAGRIVRRIGTAWTVGGGFALAGVATIGLGRLDAGSSYAAAWPWYLLNGLGYGLLMPAVSSAGMAIIPTDHSGVGSGILNSSRQIGAAIGLAVLGSISVATVSGAWHASLGALPEATRAHAPALVQQVAGAEAQAVAAVLGPAAMAPALDAFIAGYRLSLTVAGTLLLVAAVIAFAALGSRADRAVRG
jgi:MFS transporter, DHA2 family, methylenomycin A resistance protein